MTIAIGLDLGGTYVKGAVLDLAAGTLREVRTRAIPAFTADAVDGRKELDPAALEAAGRAMLAELVDRAPDATDVLLCGQMHGLVLAGPGAEALRPATTWQDARSLTGSYARLGAVYDAATVDAVGEPPAPGYPVAVLHHLAEADDLPAGAVPLGLAAWLAARLTGGEPACDPTDAAATGAFDLRAGAWHAGAIARLGLAGLAWPRVVPGGAVIGETTVGGRTLRVRAAIGDQQAALLGALLGPDELSVNVGTGSQVARRLAEPLSGPWQLRPHAGGGWLATVTHLPAGRALAVLYALVSELPAALGQPVDPAAAWAWIDAQAQAAAPGGPTADLAFFPCRLGAAGALTDVREGHFGVGDLFAAAYDAMARNYAAAAAQVDPARACPGAVLSGGVGHRAGALGPKLETALGRPLRRSGSPEETLMGLLVLARAATGLDASVDDAREWARARG